MSLELVFFLILGVMALASGIGVVTRRNPIAAGMLLIVHFIALSGLYLSLNAQFIAVIQMLVYAGAIMVLVVFVIMLLNLGADDPDSSRFTSRPALGVALSMMLGGALIFILARNLRPGSPTAQVTDQLARVNNGSIDALGKSLFTTYVFPFEMIALVLLAAVVGAVVLTKRHLQS